MSYDSVVVEGPATGIVQYQVPSESDPWDTSYEVLLGGGYAKCECKAFAAQQLRRVQSDPAPWCKHLSQASVEAHRVSFTTKTATEMLEDEGPSIDIVDIMADAFRNGFDTGLHYGRMAERTGA